MVSLKFAMRAMEVKASATDANLAWVTTPQKGMLSKLLMPTIGKDDNDDDDDDDGEMK